MAGGDLLFLSHGYLGDVGSQTSFARWLSHKPVPSDPVNRIPVWRRTSLKVGVSRGFCCRRM